MHPFVGPLGPNFSRAIVCWESCMASEVNAMTNAVKFGQTVRLAVGWKLCFSPLPSKCIPNFSYLRLTLAPRSGASLGHIDDRVRKTLITSAAIQKQFHLSFSVAIFNPNSAVIELYCIPVIWHDFRAEPQSNLNNILFVVFYKSGK